MGHGTAACYKRGCRRIECRAAYADYIRDLRAGGGGYVSAKEAYRHVSSLGLPQHAIEQASGLSWKTVSRIFAAKGECRVWKSTADALLAVRDAPNSNVWVPAKRSIRLIAALNQLMTLREMSERCGVPRDTLKNLKRWKWLKASTARTIEALAMSEGIVRENGWINGRKKVAA